MDSFRRYEENFLETTRIVGRALRQLEMAGGNVDNVIAASVEVEGELSEAEGYLKAMDVEFRSLASVEKKGAQQKVVDYREEYNHLVQRYQTTKHNAESMALKSGATARTKLLNANMRLDQSTATLDQSRMILAQTEQIGGNILTNMEGQRETLMDAHAKVKETREFTLDARQVLRMMGTRAVMHKCFVMFTIIALLGVIGVIIYYGFVSKNKI